MTQIFIVCGRECEDRWVVKAFVDKNKAKVLLKLYTDKMEDIRKEVRDLSKDGEIDNYDYYKRLKEITDTHMDPRFSQHTLEYDISTTELEE